MDYTLIERFGKYTAILYYYKNGKRKQIWRATGIQVKGGWRAANKKAKDFVAEYENNLPKKIDNVSLAEWVKQYVTDGKAWLSPPTYTSYKSNLDAHIYPYFSRRKCALRNVTVDTIQGYYNHKIKAGVSPNSLRNHIGLISVALAESKLFPVNPCEQIKRRKCKKFKGNFYNAKKLIALLEFVEGHKMYVPIYIAAYFGLRRSEVLGLKWDAVNFESKELTVCFKIVRKSKDDDDDENTHGSSDMKTEESVRTLKLDDAVIDKLREFRAANPDSEFVCVDEFGEVLKPDYVSDTFATLMERFVAETGYKRIRYHDLRHSCASLLLKLGYNIVQIQKWLGHADSATTAKFYLHTNDDDMDEMAGSISGALSNNGGKNANNEDAD